MRTAPVVTLSATLIFIIGCREREPDRGPDVTSRSAPAASTAPREMPIVSKSVAAVKLYRDALDLRDHGHLAEASERARKALEIDPRFAQAKAVASRMVTGAEGMAMLEQALDEATAMPEAVRLEIEAALLYRKRETAKAIGLYGRIVELVPGDWRVFHQLAILLVDERRFDEAVAALEKAIALEPKAGPAYGLLGFVYFDDLDKPDQGVAMIEKYVEVAPKESNAHFALGEVSLTLGRLQEAEASYVDALALRENGAARTSLAYVHFYRGDWEDGRAALAAGRAAVVDPLLRLDFDQHVVWSYMAQRKLAEAFDAIDAYEREAAAQGVASASVVAGVLRLTVHLEYARPADALPHLATLQGRFDRQDPAIGPGMRKRLASGLKAMKVQAEARAGKISEAAKTLSSLEAVVAADPGDHRAEQWVHVARGELALARDAAKVAAEHFERCSGGAFDELGPYCNYRRVVALQKAGDPTAAELVRRQVMQKLFPDGRYLCAWVALKGMDRSPRSPGG